MRFLKFMGSVVLISAAVMVGLECAYMHYSTQADQLFRTYYKKAGTVRTLYIGNSHIGVFNNLYPESAKDVGNMSFGGQDIFRMYLVLRTIVPKSPNLKKIYLGFDYDLLGYNQTKSGQEYIDRQYYPYVDTLYNYTLTNRVMSRSSFFRANRDIAYLLHRQQEEKPLNFIPINTVSTGPAEAADASKAPGAAGPKPPHKILDPFMCRKRAEEHTLLKYKQKNIGENLAILENIVTLCRKYSLQLILFDPPKTECYRSYSSKEMLRAKNIIDSFAVANNLIYHDFYNDTSFNDDMFVDFDHLNPAGAKILDDKLAAF